MKEESVVNRYKKHNKVIIACIMNVCRALLLSIMKTANIIFDMLENKSKQIF